VDKIEIDWPGGGKQVETAAPVDRASTIRER
jgi:hypothetical protein